MTRVVKMTFREDQVEAFKELYFENCPRIAASAGCREVRLFRDQHEPNTFFTISQWVSPEALEAYRNSDLFRIVWQRTKAMFSGKPEAWSLEEVAS